MSIPGRIRRFVLICLPFLALSVLVAGCGGGGGSLSGKVYYKDQPLSGGSVSFYPESGASQGNTSAIIQTDGSYSISKLPRGPAKISVIAGIQGVPAAAFQSRGGGANPFAEKAMKKKGAEIVVQKGDAKKSAPGEVPRKYADPETSGLSVDVKGGSQTFDIKMD